MTKRETRVIVDRDDAIAARVEFTHQGPALLPGVLSLVKIRVALEVANAETPNEKIAAHGLEILLENYLRGC